MAHGKAIELSQLRDPTKTPANVDVTLVAVVDDQLGDTAPPRIVGYSDAFVRYTTLDADGRTVASYAKTEPRKRVRKPGTVQRKALARVLASDARREMKGMARRIGGRS